MQNYLSKYIHSQSGNFQIVFLENSDFLQNIIFSKRYGKLSNIHFLLSKQICKIYR